MTEQLNQTAEIGIPVSDVELLQLGSACIEAAQRSDLAAVAAAHDELSIDPNSVGKGLFIGGDIPMSDTSAYRQVGVEAVRDLAASGVVRNGATARGEEHPRWGHRVFWNQGEAGKQMNTGGRFVIEAPAEAAKNGWVTADKVTAIHTKAADGTVRNLLSLR